MIKKARRMAEDPSARSDAELLATSVRGDRDAFGTLILRYRTLVIGVAYRICGDATLAEDIAQETFIRVWSKLSTFRPRGSFRGWLCRIAANMTIDAVRKRKPATDIASTNLVALDAGPEAAVLRAERAGAVRAALMRLPLHGRTVLVLREYEGLSYQEIADALSIPLGTVKSRINDARRRLRAELSEYLEA